MNKLLKVTLITAIMATSGMCSEDFTRGPQSPIQNQCCEMITKGALCAAAGYIAYKLYCNEDNGNQNEDDGITARFEGDKIIKVSRRENVQLGDDFFSATPSHNDGTFSLVTPNNSAFSQGDTIGIALAGVGENGTQLEYKFYKGTASKIIEPSVPGNNATIEVELADNSLEAKSFFENGSNCLFAKWEALEKLAKDVPEMAN